MSDTLTDERFSELMELYDNSGSHSRAIRAVAEAAMAMEREACCKALCYECNAGVVVEYNRFLDGKWYHPQGAELPGKEDTYMNCHVRCTANEVRKRGETQ